MTLLTHFDVSQLPLCHPWLKRHRKLSSSTLAPIHQDSKPSLEQVDSGNQLDTLVQIIMVQFKASVK
ncbi:hypothetical protein [Coleofasciculus sp. E1-EBD-02]|uniref:hypothetical protein n=1 Tax=Coleofasciculus sp. E1-EBD-02 TaxID=3068481 RepID=UPI00330010D0